MLKHWISHPIKSRIRMDSCNNSVRDNTDGDPLFCETSAPAAAACQWFIFSNLYDWHSLSRSIHIVLSFVCTSIIMLTFVRQFLAENDLYFCAKFDLQIILIVCTPWKQPRMFIEINDKIKTYFVIIFLLLWDKRKESHRCL